MLALALSLAACGVPDAALQVPPEPAADAPAALSAPPEAAISARLEVLEPQVVPDGLGGTVEAPAPIGLSLAGGWGGRALDPVLVVGPRRYTEYDFPAPGVLRYTLPERAVLEEVQARIEWSEADFVDVSAAVQEALR